ncbi:ORF134 peptide [Hyphantria cunea nucleopolyhedrovirus]|uniref:ORF134 peptide n=1 Tax=Hyphantria cunea nuclear polyhedrosis virus TaxID=28288 RepID=Q2NP64_NPVHC|nr:ORF134 peptide [Hyphantria cunea nucleopolyhedrovirus]BAE72423.1 ORF134 peptide [Hyphantria cunea nucleopolyhedrovirus]
MECVANQIYRGALPYITIKDIEDRLRNQIAAKAGADFFKNCFESVVADKSGLFVLSGGAAAACHVDNARGVCALKCLDFDYYNSTRQWLHLARLQRQLQTCVQDAFENLAQITENVRMQDHLTVLKCFQNGAFRFCGPVKLRLLPHVETVRTDFSGEFDLVRFALQVEMWSPDGVDEYNDQKLILNRGTVLFNVYFVNIRVMKIPLFTERSVKTFFIFGNNYHVLVSPLQRVLNDQIMCLLKDIFTDKPDFKVARRKTRLCALFSQLPQTAFDECINNHNDVEPTRRRDESITSFCKKTLDIYGPALGCCKLVYAYFKTNTFTNQVPDYTAHYVNYPHKNCEMKWKEFIHFLVVIKV